LFIGEEMKKDFTGMCVSENNESREDEKI